MMLDEENVPPPATRLVNGPSRPDPSPSCATELFRGGGLASSNSGLMLGTMARDGACAAAMRLAVSSILLPIAASLGPRFRGSSKGVWHSDKIRHSHQPKERW